MPLESGKTYRVSQKKDTSSLMTPEALIYELTIKLGEI